MVKKTQKAKPVPPPPPANKKQGVSTTSKKTNKVKSAVELGVKANYGETRLKTRSARRIEQLTATEKEFNKLADAGAELVKGLISIGPTRSVEKAREQMRATKEALATSPKASIKEIKEKLQEASKALEEAKEVKEFNGLKEFFVIREILANQHKLLIEIKNMIITAEDKTKLSPMTIPAEKYGKD